MNKDLEFVKAVRELAAENPNFIYEAPGENRTCLYVHEGDGSCLIGQALLRVGVPLNTVAGFDETAANLPVAANEALLSLGYSGAVSEWAGYVQSLQDRRELWAESVALADNYFVKYDATGAFDEYLE